MYFPVSLSDIRNRHSLTIFLTDSVVSPAIDKGIILVIFSAVELYLPAIRSDKNYKCTLRGDN